MNKLLLSPDEAASAGTTEEVQQQSQQQPPEQPSRIPGAETLDETPETQEGAQTEKQETVETESVAPTMTNLTKEDIQQILQNVIPAAQPQQ